MNRNRLGALIFCAAFIAVPIVLAHRYPAPVAPTPVAVEQRPERDSEQILSRDGDWVEIKLETGELDYEYRPIDKAKR